MRGAGRLLCVTSACRTIRRALFDVLRRVRMILVPQELLVGARIHHDAAVTHLDHLGCQALDKVTVVRDEDERAAVVDECVEQHVFRIEVEVVGRFVEQQRVRRTEQHARHRKSRALTAGEHFHLLVDVVARKQEAAEDVSDHRHHVHGRSRG